MKCTICGDVAAINMPQHRLRLCEAHLQEWVPRMAQRAIDKYGLFTRDERILVAVSGGKDSLSLWDILIRLGYETEGLYIHLGIDHEGYSDESEERVRAFSRAHDDAPFRVVNLEETYGQGFRRWPTIGAGAGPARSVAKRHMKPRLRGRLWGHRRP